MDSSLLGVGDPVRRRVGRAVLASLAVAAGFTALTVLAKQMPVLYARQPWRDDPYDALVSFDFIALPLLVVAGLLRVQLCRRYVALPVRRVTDLLRVCGVAAVLCAGTGAAEWVAVARRAHRAQWNPLTAWQIVTLGMVSAALIGTGGLLWQVGSCAGAHHPTCGAAGLVGRCGQLGAAGCPAAGPAPRPGRVDGALG